MKEITAMEAWKDCLQASETRPVFIFKHSTACPVSAEAYRRVQEFLQQPPESLPDLYLVKVIESRSVSNTIADDTGVAHKSPQLILIKNGEGVWSSSHLFISAGAIEWALAHHVDE